MNIKPLKRNHLFIPSRFESKIEKYFHLKFLSRRKQITNKTFTIISNSCVGASVYKDFNVKFLTPFIAIYIDPDDFVLMLSDLKHWIRKPITRIDYPTKFPVGLLGGEIKLFFVHESSFDEAVRKWKYRCDRINWNNCFVILDPIKQTFLDNECKSTCSIHTIQQFFLLNYRKQICFVSKRNQIINDRCIFLRCYSKYVYSPYIGRISIPSGKRVYDKYFDIISWINDEI